MTHRMRVIPLVLALLAAGCGSSATSTGASRPAADATTSSTPKPAPSSTLSSYRYLGLRFQAPGGLAAGPPVDTKVPSVGLTPGGRDPSTANEQIVVVDNPRVRGNLDQYLQTIRTVDQGTPHIVGYRSTIGSASVRGAWDAATMTEAYAAKVDGSATPVAVAREWIFVQVGPHHVKSLLALSVPSRGGMDPRQVTSSVTLGG